MRSKKQGFTLIEFSIALAFFSILLLIIAYLVINMISMYQKGLTIKAVNTAGAELIDDFSRTISSSSSDSISKLCSNYFNGVNIQKCIDDEAKLVNYHQHTSNFDGNADSNTPKHGAFCTGQHSYLWNTAYTFDLFWIGKRNKPNNLSSYQAILRYKTYNKPEEEKILKNFRLIRFSDPNRLACIHNRNEYSTPSSSEYNLTGYLMTEEPIELIGDSENGLALYDLTLFPPSRHNLTGHSFYSGSFVLATIRGGININSVNNYCADFKPDSLSTDFAYCAVNRFNFAIHSTGKIKKEGN